MYYYKKIDESEYKLDYQFNRTWKYIRKNPINVTQKNNRNEFLYKNNIMLNAAYFGEVIGSQIAKVTIGNACDAELAKQRRGFGDIYDNGVISYYYFAKDDKQISPFFIIQDYYKNEGTTRKGLPNLDDIFGALKYLMLRKYKRPYSEYEKLKQQYVDMIMFDCRFGNFDRQLENWLLFEDGQTQEISLYPLFDNETTLGFDQAITGNASNEKIITYNRDLRMAYRAPGDGTREFSNLEDILKYMIEKFPTETEKSIEKVKTFSLEDLSKLLDEFPDMPEERKKFTKQMFLARRLLFERYIREARVEKQNENEK